MDSNFYILVLFICFSLSVTISAPAAPKSPMIVRRDIRSIIDDMLPRSVVPSISRSKRSITSGRVKRSASTRELMDPNNCIHKCWDLDEERTEQIQNAFENKAHTTDRISEDPSAQRQQLSGVMDNLGSFMKDACQSAKRTQECFRSCPNTQLKDVAIADYYVEGVACEPDNFGGYNNYRMSIFCINNTMSVSREYCAQQCHGEVKSLRELTDLAIDRNDSDSSTISFESNIGQNTARAREQCRILTCTRDCSKSYLLKRCGRQGFELYSRQLAIEPRSALNILQKVNGINSKPPECNSL